MVQVGSFNTFHDCLVFPLMVPGEQSHLAVEQKPGIPGRREKNETLPKGRKL
jgi:hypothetical protein